MDDLKLPPDTPVLYEEGLWELCTDKAYEMMVHKRQFLDDEIYNYFRDHLDNSIGNKTLSDNLIKILKIMIP